MPLVIPACPTVFLQEKWQTLMATTNVKLLPQQVRNSTISFDQYTNMMIEYEIKGIIDALT